MLSTSRIEDEHGTIWEVQAKDPARKQVNQLKSAGYHWIVLTRELLCGTLDSRACVSVPRARPPRPADVASAPHAEAYARWIRLEDCIAYLKDLTG